MRVFTCFLYNDIWYVVLNGGYWSTIKRNKHKYRCLLIIVLKIVLIRNLFYGYQNKLLSRFLSFSSIKHTPHILCFFVGGFAYVCSRHASPFWLQSRRKKTEYCMGWHTHTTTTTTTMLHARLCFCRYHTSDIYSGWDAGHPIYFASRKINTETVDCGGRLTASTGAPLLSASRGRDIERDEGSLSYGMHSCI